MISQCWRWQASLWNLILVFILLIANTGSQNCGFPSTEIRLSAIAEDSRSELPLVEGGLRTVHLQTAQYDVHCSSSHLDSDAEFPFARIRTDANSSRTHIALHPEVNLTHLIDQLKLTSCSLQVEIQCSDDQKKTAKFVVPLIDKNTHQPVFTTSVPNLHVELPWNHAVPINYDENSLLVVEDQDRDCQYTEIELEISVQVETRAGFDPESWFYVQSRREIGQGIGIACERDPEDEGSLQQQLPTPAPGPGHHRHLVTLYFRENENVTMFELARLGSISVTILVRDARDRSLKSTMSINIEFSLKKLDWSPPEFSQFMYEVSILNFSEAELPSLSISARDPDGLTGVRYELTRPRPFLQPRKGKREDDDFLAIDERTGRLSFTKNLTLPDIEGCRHEVGVWQVKAVQTDSDSRYSMATLLIYFDFDIDEEFPTSTEPPTDMPSTTSSSTTTSSTTTTTTTPQPTEEPTELPTTSSSTTTTTTTTTPQPTEETTELPTTEPTTMRPTTRPPTSTVTPTTEFPTPEPEPTLPPTEEPTIAPTEMPTEPIPTTTAPEPTTTQEPVEPEPTTTEIPGPCVNLPDEEFCNRYYACEPEPRGYVLRPMCCSHDVLELVYCLAKNECIHPWEVDEVCPACTGKYDETCLSTQPPPSTTEPAPSTPPEEVYECPPEAETGDWPHPKFCNRFLSCRDIGGGEMITESMCCAKGPVNEPYLTFCHETKRCVNKWEMNNGYCPSGLCTTNQYDPECLVQNTVNGTRDGDEGQSAEMFEHIGANDAITPKISSVMINLAVMSIVISIIH